MEVRVAAPKSKKAAEGLSHSTDHTIS